MKDEILYPICTILYKTENSDGWYYAIMSGEENECRKRCDEIKKKNNWCDYECYVSSRCVLNKDIPFQCAYSVRNNANNLYSNYTLSILFLQ